ncbi:hypothetical protein GALMADRAFT_105184 [Galerina marginata CBS 339.88]|uniref:Galectin n=1 Tax=Galerina marginata (strain CBS 339.88) TaxID=685588 RepID=A0A067SB63_GALM3|nr:hypothetical protein GALMADRAFT_105184 [Galerina marginata CBS 339.88]
MFSGSRSTSIGGGFFTAVTGDFHAHFPGTSERNEIQSPGRIAPSVGFYQIPLSRTINLDEPVKTDGIVMFRSSILNLDPTTASTWIDLLGSGGDIILHISFRLLENVIVFNSRPAHGEWLNESRVNLTGSFIGQNYTVTVFDHGDRYQVLTNGRTKSYYYKQLKGDVTAVSYNTNVGQTSIFSDTIAAQTYNSFAALVPGSA